MNAEILEQSDRKCENCASRQELIDDNYVYDIEYYCPERRQYVNNDWCCSWHRYNLENELSESEKRSIIGDVKYQMYKEEDY